MVVFSKTLSDSSPYFKVTPSCDAEYLRNDTRFKCSYNGILVGPYITMAYFTTIVTLLFDENDIFISLESSIHALQDGCSISVGYKI